MTEYLLKEVFFNYIIFQLHTWHRLYHSFEIYLFIVSLLSLLENVKQKRDFHVPAPHMCRAPQ